MGGDSPQCRGFLCDRDFLALLTLATFFRDAGLGGDFRAAVFFASRFPGTADLSYFLPRVPAWEEISGPRFSLRSAFLALLTLATFFRDAGLGGDFRAAATFFAIGFLALLTLATFFRDAVFLGGDFRAAVFFASRFPGTADLSYFLPRVLSSAPSALADVLGDVPLT